MDAYYTYLPTLSIGKSAIQSSLFDAKRPASSCPPGRHGFFFGMRMDYFLKTTQLWDQGTGSPKSVTTSPCAFRYQE